jgi:hypothetical protein
LSPTVDEHEFQIIAAEKQRLRELARKVLDLSQHPLNVERRRRWYALDEGVADQPIVLAECNERLEMVKPDLDRRCQLPWARSQELALLDAIVHFEDIRDDRVIEPFVNCPWFVSASDYGVTTHYEKTAASAAGRSAYRWDPPVTDLARPLDKLHPRTFTVDRPRSLRLRAALEEVYAGLLTVRWRTAYWWTMGMTWSLALLIGLEQLMMAMFDQPAGLHQLMSFLRDDHLAFVDWLEAEGLFTLNNHNDYIGSGSHGYTRRLPRPGQDENSPPQAADLWVLLESQETVGVGPAQFEEFIFPYQAAIARRFGACYYGCCEPVHNRWHVVEKLPNLRRVSVSPWCDQQVMAAALANRCVFSRKPSPTLISTGDFDESAIRADVSETLRTTASAGCRSVELIMKDIHTLSGHPDRLARWVQLAREEIERNW